MLSWINHHFWPFSSYLQKKLYIHNTLFTLGLNELISDPLFRRYYQSLGTVSHQPVRVKQIYSFVIIAFIRNKSQLCWIVMSVRLLADVKKFGWYMNKIYTLYINV